MRELLRLFALVEYCKTFHDVRSAFVRMCTCTLRMRMTDCFSVCYKHCVELGDYLYCASYYLYFLYNLYYVFICVYSVSWIATTVVSYF